MGEVGEVITARGETSCPSGPYRVTMGPRYVQQSENGTVIRAQVWTLLHSFNKYLMNFCYVRGIVLDTRDRTKKKANFLFGWWVHARVERARTQANRRRVAVISGESKGRGAMGRSLLCQVVQEELPDRVAAQGRGGREPRGYLVWAWAWVRDRRPGGVSARAGGGGAVCLQVAGQERGGVGPLRASPRLSEGGAIGGCGAEKWQGVT